MGPWLGPGWTLVGPAERTRTMAAITAAAEGRPRPCNKGKSTFSLRESAQTPRGHRPGDTPSLRGSEAGTPLLQALKARGPPRPRCRIPVAIRAHCTTTPSLRLSSRPPGHTTRNRARWSLYFTSDARSKPKHYKAWPSTFRSDLQCHPFPGIQFAIRSRVGSAILRCKTSLRVASARGPSHPFRVTRNSRVLSLRYVGP